MARCHDESPRISSRNRNYNAPLKIGRIAIGNGVDGGESYAEMNQDKKIRTIVACFSGQSPIPKQF